MENSITLNKERVGNFTSSNNWKLTKFAANKKDFGEKAKTYIAEKNMERKLGLSLSQETYAKPMAWGKIIEMYVHEKKLDTTYQSVGDRTLPHPTIDFWKGSPDFICPSKKLIAECKAYERKNFVYYADAILTKDTEVLKKECEEEYWQMVSNAIILGFKHIQPILFMPYFSELPEISKFAANVDDKDQWMYKFIFDAVENGNYASLPYLMDNGYYQNFISCVLEVPQADIDFLTERITEAGKLLIPYWTPTI